MICCPNYILGGILMHYKKHGGKFVTKSNAICRARWSPCSVLEPRIIAVLASKISKDDKEFAEYAIHLTEITKGARGGNVYTDVKNAIRNMMSRVIEIYVNGNWVFYNVFMKCEFIREHGLINISFHKDLKDHYLEIGKNFTKYELCEFMALPSIYSQRIYEYLRSWDDMDGCTASLCDLHKMMQTPESLNKNFKDFRRRVLEKAHKDIHAHTTMKYKWSAIKSGARVVEIKFTFLKGKAALKAAMATKKKTKTPSKKIPNKTKGGLPKLNIGKTIGGISGSNKNTEQPGMVAYRCRESKNNKCSSNNPETPNICALCHELYSSDHQK